MLHRRDGVSPLTAHAQSGSHSRDVFRPVAERAGITVEAMLAQAAAATLLKRQPTLAEVASTAVFLASDQAGAMTGASPTSRAACSWTDRVESEGAHRRRVPGVDALLARLAAGGDRLLLCAHRRRP